MKAIESEIAETARWFASPRFEGVTRLYSARQVVEQRGHHPARLHRGAHRRRAVLRPPARAVPAAQADHDLRALFARTGGGLEADGDRGDLPGRLGHLGQGLAGRGSRARPGQLPAEPGARRGRAHRARAADRRPQPALRPLAPERGPARRHARGRLPPLHHRRRRHGARRRRPRAQPGAPLRRGGRARLPHRGPEAGGQEVRPPGGQGPRRRGRADQAPQRRPLPAGRHEGAGHRGGPHRRRVGHLPRRARRRARPPLHPGGHQRRAAHLQDRLPHHPRASCASWGWRTCTATCCSRSRPPNTRRPAPGCPAPACCASHRGAGPRAQEGRGPGPRGACSTRSTPATWRPGRRRPTSRATPRRWPTSSSSAAARASASS